MSRYNIYDAIGLDPHQPAEQLAAQLSQSRQKYVQAGYGDEDLGLIDTALALFSDADKKATYDSWLADPNADFDYDNILTLVYSTQVQETQQVTAAAIQATAQPIEPEPTITSTPAGYENDDREKRSTSTSNAANVAIGVLVVAILGVVGFILGLYFFDNRGTPQAEHQVEQNTEDLAAEEPPAAEQPEPVPADTQQPSPQDEETQDTSETIELPGNANPVDAQAGLYSAGSASDQFARAVHEAYMQGPERQSGDSFTLEAHSPVTNLDYTLNCEYNGSFATCTGGNNAIIYIQD